MTQKLDSQKNAEAKVEGFRKNLGPFVVAAETTRMAMVFTDATEAANPIIFANDSFLSLTGYHRDEVLGKGFDFFMAHCADTETKEQIQKVFNETSNGATEILYRRKDKSEFWAAVFVSPVHDKQGAVVQYFGSFVDLTRHKADAAKSKLLIDELNHRVKNTLSTVQSIVWQATRAESDPKLVRKSIEARLSALSRSHDLLTHENWEGAGLFDIVRDALEPFGVSDSRAERIKIKGENIRFPPQAALILSIVFNELATNAMKYGALSNEAGSILIKWKVETTPAGEQIFLDWLEKDGPPVTVPLRTGFGSQVIERGLAHQLEGTAQLNYLPDGLFCRMTFPIPKVATGE